MDNAVLIVIFVLIAVLVRSEIAGCIISQVVAAYTVIPVGKVIHGIDLVAVITQVDISSVGELS